MTPQNLQEEIKEMLLEVTKKLTFKNPDGETTRLNVFKQELPKRKYEEETEPFPYCVVKIINGNSDATNGANNTIRVLLIFGIYDGDTENQGHMTVLEIINKIIRRLSENNALKTFWQTGAIEWAIDDEDVYPYFYGGMDLTFSPIMYSGRVNDFI